ncbi:uncharacterized protein BJX67DRAFT_353033 [Aspergillus lucknowensis]|uniref:C2H2-type domain-containing protein n=1 Tax=Aspergillus lucknowensis TaxID=176173 RepID=A0ABR4LS75_9EURO
MSPESSHFPWRLWAHENEDTRQASHFPANPSAPLPQYPINMQDSFQPNGNPPFHHVAQPTPPWLHPGYAMPQPHPQANLSNINPQDNAYLYGPRDELNTADSLQYENGGLVAAAYSSQHSPDTYVAGHEPQTPVSVPVPHSYTQNGNASRRVSRPSGPDRTPDRICPWAGCNYTGTFSREAELRRHIDTQHRFPKSFKCQAHGCEKAFNRKDNLAEHLRRVHSGVGNRGLKARDGVN